MVHDRGNKKRIARGRKSFMGGEKVYKRGKFCGEKSEDKRNES